MPSKIHGKDADLWVNALSMEDDGNTITLIITPDTVESSAFASLAKENLEGLYGFTLAYRGFWNSAANANDQTFYQLIGAGAKEFKFFPGGSASAKIFYLGSAIMTSFNSESPIAGMVTCDADFLGTGNLSRGTAA